MVYKCKVNLTQVFAFSLYSGESMGIAFDRSFTVTFIFTYECTMKVSVLEMKVRGLGKNSRCKDTHK